MENGPSDNMTDPQDMHSMQINFDAETTSQMSNPLPSTSDQGNTNSLKITL